MLRQAAFTTFVCQWMLNATRPLIALQASELGASTAMIGWLAATYGIFPLLVAIKAGKIADRFGVKLPVLFGVSGMMAGTAIPFWMSGLEALFLSQAVVGLTQIFINVSLQNIVGNASDEKERDRRYSTYTLGASSGALIGPVTGGYMAERFDFETAYLGAAILGVLPLLLALRIPGRLGRRRGESGGDGGGGVRLIDTLRLLQLGPFRKALVISSLVLFSKDVFVLYFPIYGASIGLSFVVIGWILTIQGAVSIAVRVVLPHLTNRWGRERVLAVSLIAGAFSFILFPMSDSVIWIAVFSALLGAGMGCGTPISMSSAYQASPAGRTGEALGLRLANNRLTQVVGPLFFGWLGSLFGFFAIFYVSAALLLGGTYWSRDRAKAAAVRDETDSAPFS